MTNKIRPIYAGFNEFKKRNAQPVLEAVERWIRILEMRHEIYPKWSRRYKTEMDEVFVELSIFDWWTDYISLNQLKQMRTFLREAIKLGYTGYVCFKVGASGCANGMWASKLPTTNGYSPKGESLYRSFTPDYTYWDISYNDEYGDKADHLTKRVGKKFDELTTIKDLENALNETANLLRLLTKYARNMPIEYMTVTERLELAKAMIKAGTIPAEEVA